MEQYLAKVLGISDNSASSPNNRQSGMTYWYSQFFENPKLEKIAETYDERTYPSRFVDDQIIKKRLEEIESSDWKTNKNKSIGLCIVDNGVCLYQLKFKMDSGIVMNADRSPRVTKVIPQYNDYLKFIIRITQQSITKLILYVYVCMEFSQISIF